MFFPKKAPSDIKKSEFMLDALVNGEWMRFCYSSERDYYPNEKEASERAQRVLDNNPDAILRIRNYWGAVVFQTGVNRDEA